MYLPSAGNFRIPKLYDHCVECAPGWLSVVVTKVWVELVNADPFQYFPVDCRRMLSWTWVTPTGSTALPQYPTGEHPRSKTIRCTGRR